MVIISSEQKLHDIIRLTKNRALKMQDEAKQGFKTDGKLDGSKRVCHQG